MTKATFPNLIIRASAGTGKTFQLSNRYLGLVGAHQPASQILATTFTRKAAGEILDRIILRLAAGCYDDPHARALGEFLGRPDLTKSECEHLLAGLLADLNVLKISTLDSYFSRLARRFSLELGLGPAWSIVDEVVDAQLRTEAIRRVLTESRSHALLRLLTKGDADRNISKVVSDTVSSLYELFRDSDRSAWEMVKPGPMLDDSALDETIAALSAVETPTPGMKNQVLKDLELVSAGDWEGFVCKGIGKKLCSGETTFNRKPLTEEIRLYYGRLLKHAQAVQLRRVAQTNEGAYALLERFDHHYQALKRESRALRFEDVTRLLSDAALHHELERLAFRSDGQIDHLLLDEFQDTSPAQWSVIHGLADRITHRETTRSFFCVGDLKQAIYGWRGGVAEIFETVGKQLSNISAAPPLTTSYRSSPVVIDTVNQIFTRVTDHQNLDRFAEPVKKWCEKFETHHTAKGELSGYATLRTADPDGDVLDTAARVVEDLLTRQPDQTIAVLVRKNSSVASLIHKLGQRRILASEEGGNPLTDSAAVQLVLSALWFADHPGDRIARFHLISGPAIDWFRTKGKPATGDPSERVDLLSPLSAAEIRHDLEVDGYGRTIEAWAQMLQPYCNPRESTRLAQLVEMAYVFGESPSLRPSDFVRHVESNRVSDPRASNVRVMTIHQSKGLEFDTVILADLDGLIGGQPPGFVVHRPDPAGKAEGICDYVNNHVRSLLPKKIQSWFDEELNRSVAEAMCVLYVAVTRAVRSLWMITKPKGNERSLPKTAAGLLRAALSDGAASPEGETLFEIGDPDWMLGERVTNVASPPQPELPPKLQKKAIQLAKHAGPRRRGLEFASPSGLEGGTKMKLDQVLQSGNQHALQVGTLIHAWFEQVQWLDSSVPDDRLLKQVALRIPDLDVDIESWLATFRTMLSQDAVKAMLSKSTYLAGDLGDEPGLLRGRIKGRGIRPEVFNEYRFAIPFKGGILNGSIDRLVQMYEGKQIIGAEIIDFKTDQIDLSDPKSLRNKVDHYRPQIEAYQQAVATFTGLPLDQVGGRLVFVQSGRMSAIC